jgi:serine/threonine protein kinase
MDGLAALPEHSPSLIRVFISYSHDSGEHKEHVLALSERLLCDGIDAHLDQYESSPPEGWPNWMLNQINDAQWILIVCTDRYHQRVRGREEPGSGLGAKWEGAIITQTLYEADAKNTKFVPIIFTPEDRNFIPIFLRGSTYFLLPSSYEDLYRHLRREPWIKKGFLGPLRGLRPRTRTVRLLPTGSRSAAFQEEVELAREAARKLQEETAIQGGDLSAVKSKIRELERAARRGWEPEEGNDLSGRFRLIERVGDGNYGTVWKAYDLKSEDLVAVKILKGESNRDQSRRDRFFRGARSMVRLSHPGIVRIIEPEIEEDGLSFYVMEYVPGGNLQTAILEKTIDQTEGLRALLVVGEAVAYAHYHGYIHRDIKPSNILLDPHGHPKLTDFDLVLTLESTGGTQNEPLGTWPYMAPEAQVEPSSVTTKADVFSLGMTGFFILAGRLIAKFPYNREFFIKNLDCPAGIKEALLPAVEVDPSARYLSVEELCRNLRRALQEEAQFQSSQRMEREEERNAGSDGETARLRKHSLHVLVSHLHAAGDWERIFALIETKPFLADQARHLGGFEHGSRDLEEYAIPATIQKSDWVRFFHYSILALNFRGIAEGVAQPGILKSLSQAGFIEWAKDITNLLSDPLDRAEALAAIAASCDDRNLEKKVLVEKLRDDINSVPSASRWTDIDHRAEALCNIGRRLGPELYGSWGFWISQFGLGAKEARRVRRAVVESWIDRGDLQTSRFWERLRAMDDPPALLEIVRNLRSGQVVLPRDAIDRLEPLFQGRADLFHRARAILFGRQARENPARISSLLAHWLEGQEITWSPELIEDAADLIAFTSPQDLDLLAQRLPTPLLRAALRVIALEALPNAMRAAEALKEVEAISEPNAKLHWWLRYLASHPRVRVVSYQQELLAVREHLRRVRYIAAPEDLCRFLDLISEALPNNLERELEALLAGVGSPGVVSAIAHGTKTKALAELLLEKAERFAALTAPSEAEGFRLRYDLITQAVCRLCVLTGDLSFLEDRTYSLLSEEEDELRSLLATQLAEIENRDPRQHRLSYLVCDGIQDSRFRLLTLLRIASREKISHALQPTSLYQAMYDVKKLEDELLGLAVLQSLPLDPLHWTRQNLPLFREALHSARVVLRLAEHALRFQPGDLAGLELVGSSLHVRDDRSLAELTPQIVEFAAHTGKARRATEEFQEAAEKIFTLPLPWAFRLEAFEDLLATFQRVFLDETALLGTSQAVQVLKAFLRLPLDLKPHSSRAELRDRWRTVLPMIIGSLELFPQNVQSSLSRQMEASAGVLSPIHEWFSAACCSSAAERLDLARSILEATAPDPGQVMALVYLLARSAPDLIVKLLVNGLVEKDRNRLCLRLIRHGWVSREMNLSLRKLMTDEVDRLQADLWTFPRRPADAEDWLCALGGLLVLGDLDLSDPRTEPLIRRLWDCPPNIGHPVLAAAVVEALRSRGWSQAESALRFWLHSFLAPSLGAESSRGQVRVAELSQVLRRAMTLPAT